MRTLIECIPNFSEGRNPRTIDAIARAILAGPDVQILDRTSDPDHNRSVITFIGAAESIGEAALRAIGRASGLIDLSQHSGVHPRIGATDVVPFVPVSGATLQDCAAVATSVAERVWKDFRIPVYLYEAAAIRPERRHLENLRRGGFEWLREAVRTDLALIPDFGEPMLHPTAGATVIGARNFLIAYNINLNTPDVALARVIARKIRASGGGLPAVKALGLELRTRGLAQVSINLTNFEVTSLRTVFDAVAAEAAEAGVEIESSEIVGLLPREALSDGDAAHLKIRGFSPAVFVESHLAGITA